MPKWKIALLRGLLLIFISYFTLSAGYDYDYDEQKDSWGRCPWIRNRLKNGRIRIRSRGRIAKFTCKSGYELVGRKFATCVRGQWNNPIPACIAKGCPKITAVANGIVTEKYRGAQLTFGCNPGYNLSGEALLFCDGSQWDKSAPRCQAATMQPQKVCDFEDPDLCGWSHDPTHDFDWRRHQFKTPSGHVGTGPSYDHTFGKGKAGYYMYEEASAPRNENDTSRLFSPVYSSNYSPGCFVFWYHMYGATIGRLRIYIKPESHVFVELTPSWEKSGDQGNQWLRADVTVPQLKENFQIVIEGIRGSSYVGDTAIDDVSLINANCSAVDISNATEIEEASGDSCRGRCHEPDNSTSCGCTDTCESDNTCCADYAKLCAETSEPSGGEDESVTGKSETDATPEDNVGTGYPGTPPALFTEFITSSESENKPPVTENQQQTTTQKITSISTTAKPNTTAVASNTTIGTTISATPPHSVPDTHVSASVSLVTQNPANITSTVRTVSNATAGPAMVTVATPKALTPAILPTTATPKKKPLTTTPQQITTTKSPTTIPVTSITDSSTLTIPVSRQAVVTPAASTTKSPTEHTTTRSPTEQTTSPTKQTPTRSPTEQTTITTVASAPKINTTAKTTFTTKAFTSAIITVPTNVTAPTNITSSSPRLTAPSSTTTTSTTQVQKTTGRTSKATTTGRTSKATTAVRIISSTSTTAARPTFLKTSTVSTRRPFIRKTTTVPVILKTLSTYSRNIRTTRTTTSPFYSTKSQTTTADSLKDGNHATNSKAVASNNGSSSVIGISIGVIIIACLIGGVIFVFFRRRRQRLNKLHGDSIRFLPDNEVIEYSDASYGDPLFQT